MPSQGTSNRLARASAGRRYVLLFRGHQIGAETGQHLAGADEYVVAPPVAVLARADRHLDAGPQHAVERRRRLAPREPFFLEVAGPRRRSPGGRSAGGAGPAAGRRSPVARGCRRSDDLRLVVGHEPAELLDGHLDRHGRDQVCSSSSLGFGLAAAPEAGRSRRRPPSATPVPSCTTVLRPLALAISSARSARRSMVSGVSPGWISVTPKLTVMRPAVHLRLRQSG